MQHAAESICKTDDIDAQKQAGSCVADATAHAVASARSPKVTALYARKTGAPAGSTTRPLSVAVNAADD